MRRKRLLWQLYPSYLVVSLVALVIVGWFATRSVHDFYLERTSADLEARAILIREQISGSIGISDPGKVDALCKVLGREASTRITVIDSSGKVVGDSHEEPASMENHLNPDRPEVMKAMDGATGTSTHYSTTLRWNMMYVAVPLRHNGKTVAVVRTSLPLTSVESALRSIYAQIGLGLLVVAVLIAGTSLIVSRRISRPLEELKHGAERFARGELGFRLPVPKQEEIGSLAESMNQMAAQLDEKIARLRQLETVRRDFVANVSHELRTPITPIKAAVETLQEGALRDEQEAKHFVNMIARHADRLGAIIEDLLSLSRIEEEEKAGIDLEQGALEPVLRAAIQACSAKADHKNVRIELACPERLQAGINPPLLENAAVNLIDNAIKYSDPGRTVWVEAKRAGGEILIQVRDQGCGIEKEQLPRLFERFYRVDKARSRMLGGTGLGLAIVKHIAQTHGGRVSVESTPGEGSIFSLRLPIS